MKKVLTLMAIFLATLTASAQDTKVAEKDLELVGNGLTLPPNYVTGHARIDFMGRYSELRLYDLQNGDDATADQNIDLTMWPVIHLEFEQLPDSFQLHLEGSEAKWYLLDNTVNPLTYDFNIPADFQFDENEPMNKMGLANISNSNKDRTVIVNKICLKSSTDDDADELQLYYSPLQNYTTFHQRVIWSDSKVLSGRVDFLKAYAELGGASWVPQDELASATNAIWTIELNEPLPSGDFMLKVTDSDRDYYYMLDEGQSTITYNFQDPINPSYSPTVLSKVTKVSIQYNDNGKNQNPGDYPQTLDIKSAKLQIISSATGITNIQNKALDNNAPIYNLNGQRVSTAKKGVYIQNGHKFIVK